MKTEQDKKELCDVKLVSIPDNDLLIQRYGRSQVKGPNKGEVVKHPYFKT